MLSTKKGREFASRGPNEGFSEKPMEKRKVRSHRFLKTSSDAAGEQAREKRGSAALGLTALSTLWR